jgi:hypothetical protein
MHQNWLRGAVVLATLLFWPATGWADEQLRVAPRHRVYKAEIVSSCRAVWRCGPYGCEWHRVCPRRCPAPYACHSLYGAYGPYGGVAYWNRYYSWGW